MNANPPRYGFRWQCVELVARLWKTRGWGDNLWLGDAGAKAFYTKAANGDWADQGIVAKANGSRYTPVPGDVIVHEANGTNQYGHAVVFDHFNGNEIWAVGQNDEDSQGNYATWVVYQWDPATGTISKDGAVISGFVHSEKNTFTNKNPDGTVPYSSVVEGKPFFATDGWIYIAVGKTKVAFPIMNQEWNKYGDDDAKWGGKPIGPVSVDEVHDHEAGYDRNGRAVAAHAPADGTAVYVDSPSSHKPQYFFLNGKAYHIKPEEVDDLGVRDKAQRIPATGNRLSDFTTLGAIVLPDRARYRIASTQRVNLVSQHPNGTQDAYHANNDAVLYCLEITEGGPDKTRVLPLAARPYLRDPTGRSLPEINQPAACAFPPQIVVKTPEDPKQFRVTGNNDSVGYKLRPYPNALLSYLHTNGSPDLRTTKSIYGITQGSNMTPPQGAFFLYMPTGEVFRSFDGQYRKVLSPLDLICFGNPSIIKIPGYVMEGMVQGPPLGCATSALSPALSPASGPESAPPAAPQSASSSEPAPTPLPQLAPAKGPESTPASEPTPVLPASESTPPAQPASAPISESSPTVTASPNSASASPPILSSAPETSSSGPTPSPNSQPAPTPVNELAPATASSPNSTPTSVPASRPTPPASTTESAPAATSSPNSTSGSGPASSFTSPAPKKPAPIYEFKQPVAVRSQIQIRAKASQPPPRRIPSPAKSSRPQLRVTSQPAPHRPNPSHRMAKKTVLAKSR